MGDKAQRIIRLERQKIFNRCKNDYYAYMQFVHQEMSYKPNRLGRFLCTTINDAIKKREENIEMINNGSLAPNEVENQYIILSVPPQHGKSMHLTETLPSYFLGKFPNDSVIVAGYNDDFATDFGRANKQKIQEFGKDIFNIELDPNAQSASKFAIKNKRGKALFAGIKGGITGKPANLVIIDDPIKNRQDANSKTNRDAVWKEWRSTISSRIHPNSIVIIIMTRWHSDDLVGRMFSNDYGKSIIPWNYINIPFLCEDESTDIFKRKLGEQILENSSMRRTDIQVKDLQSDSELFNSLYQGHPTLEEGNIIKKDWFDFYTPDITINDMDFLAISVDATFKKTDTSDFVAIQVWGKLNTDYYLFDLVNERLSFTETLDEIKRLTSEYPQNDAVFIEDKANGSAIIDILHKQIHNIVPISPKDSKETRVWAITSILRGKHVKLPRNDSMSEKLIGQCLEFPNGAHDDMIDAMSQALNELKYYDTGKKNKLKPYNPGDERYESYLERIGVSNIEEENQNYLINDF